MTIRNITYCPTCGTRKSFHISLNYREVLKQRRKVYSYHLDCHCDDCGQEVDNLFVNDINRFLLKYADHINKEILRRS